MFLGISSIYTLQLGLCGTGRSLARCWAQHHGQHHLVQSSLDRTKRPRKNELLHSWIPQIILQRFTVPFVYCLPAGMYMQLRDTLPALAFPLSRSQAPAPYLLPPSFFPSPDPLIFLVFFPSSLSPSFLLTVAISCLPDWKTVSSRMVPCTLVNDQ